MAVDISDLESWFAGRPKWLQDAARRIVEKEMLSTTDYEELAELCIKEATTCEFQYAGLSAGALNIADTATPLRMDSIADVTGVNALSCTKPISLSEKPITIVYGRNGSGKSGYIRLLKHICSARRPGPLHGNVFTTENPPKSAKITYTKGDIQQTADWKGESIPDLAGIEIYDTACGLAYVQEENEVSAEPCLLRFFSSLTNVCTKTNEVIEEKSRLLASHLPKLPAEHIASLAGQWFQGITSETQASEIEAKWLWAKEQEDEHAELTKRLAEGNPADKARVLRRQKTNLFALKTTLVNCQNSLEDEQFKAFLVLKHDASNKKLAAEVDAQKVFANAPLEGVGTESWQMLWNAARDYSTACAYKDKSFPFVDSDSRCVLCQSPLNSETSKRLESFEAFVNGQLQQLADEAQKEFGEKTKTLPKIPSLSEIELKLQAGGQDSNKLSEDVVGFRNVLQKRYEAFLVAESVDSLSTMPEKNVPIDLENAAAGLESEALVLDEDAKGQNREVLSNKLKELTARKWVYQQREAIKTEIARMQTLAGYQKAKDLTSTQALSRRKSLLADELITQAYVDRFQKELSDFGAESIRVEIQKTRTQVGKVFHRLSLSRAGATIKADEVLSEGELRIVSLSAFLADTEGRDSKTTFIFDDPISSLDHVYEEATAKRLVELSSKRQVIVFTHRLSLIGFLQKYSEKQGIENELVALSKYKPGALIDVPIDVKRTDRAINTLLNDRVSELRKAYEADEVLYETLAKALCRDTRVLLERVVECDLLNGVVQRFSPEVQTKGRLAKLPLVTVEDCKFIDDCMTKFSRFEHSQPDETPIAFPTPDEIKPDLLAIKEFIDMLRKRG